MWIVTNSMKRMLLKPSCPLRHSPNGPHCIRSSTCKKRYVNCHELYETHAAKTIVAFEALAKRPTVYTLVYVEEKMCVCVCHHLHHSSLISSYKIIIFRRDVWIDAEMSSFWESRFARFWSFESRVFIENWKWVSKGCGSYFVHPGKPLEFPPL